MRFLPMTDNKAITSGSRQARLEARRIRAEAEALRARLRAEQIAARMIVFRSRNTRAWVQAAKAIRRARGG
jgi:hypothetical protein